MRRVLAERMMEGRGVVVAHRASSGRDIVSLMESRGLQVQDQSPHSKSQSENDTSYCEYQASCCWLLLREQCRCT